MQFVNEVIQKQLALKNFAQFTLIQQASFEKITSGKNIIGISPTGTGKTLAYALPLIEKIKPEGILKALVLAPTQELAQQIGQVFKEWSNLSVNIITGGANIKRQIENLKKKPDVIIATPGRLNELAQQSKKIKFHQLETIVLDEADFLLQDDQLKVVREVVKRAPSQRQLLLYSATSNDVLRNINSWFNGDFEWIEIEKTENTIEHVYMITEDRKRFELLKKLAFVPNMKALVFVKNNVSINDLYEKLVFENIKVAILSSDTHANVRKEALMKFRKNEINYLITSDVSSRGLDIDNLHYIINYDLPREKDVYTHRSGRIGRMGKSGTVINFVNQHTLSELKKIGMDIKEVEVKYSKILSKKEKKFTV